LDDREWNTRAERELRAALVTTYIIGAYGLIVLLVLFAICLPRSFDQALHSAMFLLMFCVPAALPTLLFYPKVLRRQLEYVRQEGIVRRGIVVWAIPGPARARTSVLARLEADGSGERLTRFCFCLPSQADGLRAGDAVSVAELPPMLRELWRVNRLLLTPEPH